MPNVVPVPASVPSLSDILSPSVSKPVRDVAYWRRAAPELVQFLDDPGKLLAVVRDSPSEAMRRAADMAVRDLFPGVAGGIRGVDGRLPSGHVAPTETPAAWRAPSVGARG